MADDVDYAFLRPSLQPLHPLKMTSKAFSQSGFLYPKTPAEHTVEGKKNPKRTITVYDAVAGRTPRIQPT